MIVLSPNYRSSNESYNYSQRDVLRRLSGIRSDNVVQELQKISDSIKSAKVILENKLDPR